METTKHSEAHHDHSNHKGPGDHTHHKGHHYRKLLWMTLISFGAMYLLMYSMVDRWANVIPNINQFYMAGLMTGSMIIIELAVMGKMYPNKKLNAALFAISIVLTIGFYVGIRQQSFVGDKQFLKSMIPHHAAAILMVEKTTLQDPELKALGDSIISAQQKEIDFMKRKLKELQEK